MLIGVLALAMLQDLKSYKIKNWLIILGLIASLVCFDKFTLEHFLKEWIVGVSLPIVICFPIFCFGGIGAGDVKLFAVIGGFYSFFFSIKVMIGSILIGAALSFVKMLYYKNFLIRFQYLINYIRHFDSQCSYYCSDRDGKECVIHFTIPILISTLLIMCA